MAIHNQKRGNGAPIFREQIIKYEEGRVSVASQTFYAVAKGQKPGIYTNWPEAQAQVRLFRGRPQERQDPSKGGRLEGEPVV
ncbi:RNase H1/viroplasmin domain-containing protein [Desulfoluna spongiiphila]|uniref:RNase H1/viroplasmin domain-containing protein n=1 Tax=Desulfoluna spongiiphila TaxID=419481 RepID=UPI001D021970